VQNLGSNKKIGLKISEKMKEHLRYHRNNIFLKEEEE